jgi:hypothetical protein
VSSMMWMFLAIFLVTDLIIVTLVLRRMSPVLQLLQQAGDANRSQLLKTAHDLVREYLQANYSGDVAQLPGVLSGLMSKLRDLLRNQGVELDPATLKALVEIAAAKQRVATLQQIREALATVA